MVGPTDPYQNLEKRVKFHLHPTFKVNEIVVSPQDGRATLRCLAWGAFTVGAEVAPGTDHTVKLELDLSKLPDAPPLFRSR